MNIFEELDLTPNALFSTKFICSIQILYCRFFSCIQIVRPSTKKCIISTSSAVHNILGISNAGETEGAQRMRIRLERCHSGIDSKHYKSEHRGKGMDRSKSKNSPFSYLVKAPSGMSSVIIAQLSSNDRILHMEQCSLVSDERLVTG